MISAACRVELIGRLEIGQKETILATSQPGPELHPKTYPKETLLLMSLETKPRSLNNVHQWPQIPGVTTYLLPVSQKSIFPPLQLSPEYAGMNRALFQLLRISSSQPMYIGGSTDCSTLHQVATREATKGDFYPFAPVLREWTRLTKTHGGVGDSQDGKGCCKNQQPPNLSGSSIKRLFLSFFAQS